MATQTEQIAELIEASSELTEVFLGKEAEIDKKVNDSIALNEQKVDDFIAGSNSFSFNATQANIETELNKAPNGAKINIKLTEDIDWDFNYVRDNISLSIELRGHLLNLKEHYVNEAPFLYGINGTGCSVSILGNNNVDSKVVLPVKTLSLATGTHGAFLFPYWFGSVDSNNLSLSYGLTVVDNGDFYLIATKAGSSFAVSGVSLDSASRDWKNLVFGMQIVNDVAKNFSTNISLA